MIGDDEPMPQRPLLELSNGDDVLAALRTVDEGSLYFTRGGLADALVAAQAAHTFATWMRQLALADEVPQDIRRNFDRVRKLFLYGLLERDLFSLVDNEAHLVLEGALRHRFVSYYNGELPIWRNDASETVAMSSFNEYYDLRPSLRGCHLRPSAESKEQLPFSYRALYTWARKRKLLVGQRNVGIFASLVNSRNYAMHPESHSESMPPWVVRLLVDVVEIINKLWGHSTDGGRLFPGPVHRQLRCVALSPDRTAAVTFGSLAGVQTEQRTRDWTFAVFLAAAREELIDFDWEATGQQRFKHEPGFQITDFPVEEVVAPTTVDEVLRFIQENDVDAITDAVQFQDRLFYVRRNAISERPEFPRAPEDMFGFDGEDESAFWYVLRADFPMDAWVRIRDDTIHESQQALGTEMVAELLGDRAARAHAISLD